MQPRRAGRGGHEHDHRTDETVKHVCRYGKASADALDVQCAADSSRFVRPALTNPTRHTHSYDVSLYDPAAYVFVALSSSP